MYVPILRYVKVVHLPKKHINKTVTFLFLFRDCVIWSWI